jgi:hypothetical protein
MTYTSVGQIKARVKTRWKTPQCKFAYKQQVRVNTRRADYLSVPIEDRNGDVGTVVAVSCLPSGNIRNQEIDPVSRMWTKYYVQFPGGGEILGIHSHCLESV